MTLTMKVVDMDELVLKNYVEGCKHAVKEEKKEGTYREGHSRGIDDALRLVENSEENLTFVMSMAILGLRHSLNNASMDYFYNRKDRINYSCGYESGLKDTIKILVGSEDE